VLLAVTAQLEPESFAERFAELEVDEEVPVAPVPVVVDAVEFCVLVDDVECCVLVDDVEFGVVVEVAEFGVLVDVAESAVLADVLEVDVEPAQDMSTRTPFIACVFISGGMPDCLLAPDCLLSL